MAAELDELIIETKRKWKKAGVKQLPGATGSSMDAFERTFSVRLPAELRTWFGAVGGMELNDNDGDLLCFWQLEEVKPDEESPDYFVFADWSISCWELGVRLGESDTRVVRLAAPSLELVAPSFTAFIRTYVHDADALFR